MKVKIWVIIFILFSKGMAFADLKILKKDKFDPELLDKGGYVLLEVSLYSDKYQLKNLQLNIVNSDNETLPLSIVEGKISTFLIFNSSSELEFEGLYGKSDSAVLVREQGIRTKDEYTFNIKNIGKIETPKGKIVYPKGLEFRNFSRKWSDGNLTFTSSVGKNFGGQLNFIPSNLILRSFFSKYPLLSAFVEKHKESEKEILQEIEIQDFIHFTSSQVDAKKSSDGVFELGYENFRWDISFQDLRQRLKKDFSMFITKSSNELVAEKNSSIFLFVFTAINGLNSLSRIEITLSSGELPNLIEKIQGESLMPITTEETKILNTPSSKISIRKQKNSSYLVIFERAIE